MRQLLRVVWTALARAVRTAFRFGFKYGWSLYLVVYIGILGFDIKTMRWHYFAPLVGWLGLSTLVFAAGTTASGLLLSEVRTDTEKLQIRLDQSEIYAQSLEFEIDRLIEMVAANQQRVLTLQATLDQYRKNKTSQGELWDS